MTVQRVEALECFTCFAEVEATVSQHPVYVEESHPNVLRPQQ